MARKLKIEDLAASDFPGIDETKFNEWKSANLELAGQTRILLYIWFLLAVINSFAISSPSIISNFLLVFFCVFTVAIFIHRRVAGKRERLLARELDMNRRLLAKMTGQKIPEIPKDYQ